MNAASTVVAIGNQEGTLLFARLSEAHLMAGAIDVLLFKGAGRHADEFGGAKEIGLGEIDESGLIATGDAAGLAGEVDAVHDVYYRGSRMVIAVR